MFAFTPRFNKSKLPCFADVGGLAFAVARTDAPLNWLDLNKVSKFAGSRLAAKAPSTTPVTVITNVCISASARFDNPEVTPPRLEAGPAIKLAAAEPSIDCIAVSSTLPIGGMTSKTFSNPRYPLFIAVMVL